MKYMNSAVCMSACAHGSCIKYKSGYGALHLSVSHHTDGDLLSITTSPVMLYSVCIIQGLLGQRKEMCHVKHTT